jgi:uncharacterized protein Yka (UPF0111/DUF47 family)
MTNSIKEINPKLLSISDIMNRLNDLETRIDTNFRYIRKDIASLDNTVQAVGSFICCPSCLEN